MRDAIARYEPEAAPDRKFELANGFARIDGDRRPISAIPDDELLEGFGA